MKNKKVLIIAIVAVLVFVFAAIVIANPTLAVAQAKDPGSFTSTQPTDSSNIVPKILGFVQFVGSAVAIIMLVVLGIKYMVGSAEEKAEYKKTFIPYIVGAILIFGASNVATWIYNAVK